MRSQYLVHVVATVIAVVVGGCSLVVEFDRALLVDAAVDGGVDAGLEGAPDAGPDSSVDASAAAR